MVVDFRQFLLVHFTISFLVTAYDIGINVVVDFRQFLLLDFTISF